MSTHKKKAPPPSRRPAPPSPQQVTFENLMSFMVFHGNILSAGRSPRRRSMIKKNKKLPRPSLRFVTRTLGKIICATRRIKMEPAAHVPGPARRTRVQKQNARWLAATRNTRALPINPRLRYQSISRSRTSGVGGWLGDVNKTGQPDTLYISATSKCQDEVPLAATWQISYPSSAVRVWLRFHLLVNVRRRREG